MTKPGRPGWADEVVSRPPGDFWAALPEAFWLGQFTMNIWEGARGRFLWIAHDPCGEFLEVERYDGRLWLVDAITWAVSHRCGHTGRASDVDTGAKTVGT